MEEIICGLGALVAYDKLFLGLRAKQPCLWLWNAPGGKYDSRYDNNVLDTCRREFVEETGLLVRPTELLYTTRRPDARMEKTYIIHMYACELAGPLAMRIDKKEFAAAGLFASPSLDRLPLTDHVQEQLVPLLRERRLI